MRSSFGTVDGRRVVATPQTLSAKLAALAVIEGTCSNVSLSAAATSSPSNTATESADRARGEGGIGGEIPTAAPKGFQQEETAEKQHRQEQHQHQQQRCFDSTAGQRAREAEGATVVTERREEASSSRGSTSGSTSPVSAVTRSTGGPSCGVRRGRRRTTTTATTTTTPVPEAVPIVLPVTRGFHLVDLHAVVRNSVEWSHCLPKVRVTDGSRRKAGEEGKGHVASSRWTGQCCSFSTAG